MSQTKMPNLDKKNLGLRLVLFPLSVNNMLSFPVLATTSNLLPTYLFFFQSHLVIGTSRFMFLDSKT